MTGAQIVAAIVDILTSGITGVASAVGTGLSTLVTSIFLTGTGAEQTISMFGTIIIVFAAISLAIGLCRYVVMMLTSLGAKH